MGDHNIKAAGDVPAQTGGGCDEHEKHEGFWPE